MRELIRRATVAALLPIALTACATWPFSSGPKDIRVTSVSQVDLAYQTELNQGESGPLPSRAIVRIEFETNTDLLNLARRKEYHTSFRLGLCTKHGVKDIGVGWGYVFWNKLHVDPGTAATLDKATAKAKGPPYTYYVYANPWEQIAGKNPVCLTLAGGNMVGGRLKSNVVHVSR